MTDSDSSRTARFGTPEASRTSHQPNARGSNTSTSAAGDVPDLLQVPAEPATPRKKRALSLIRVDVRLVGALAVLLLCAMWIFFFEDLDTANTSRGDPDAGSQAEIGEPERDTPNRDGVEVDNSERQARSARVCSATMTRVFQGGTVSVADVDGWVVEIALLREGGTESLTAHPALNRFVTRPASPEGSKFIWEDEPSLAAVDTSDTLVRVAPLTNGEGPNQPRGVVLSFSGAYVDAYFKEEERRRYFHIATTLMNLLRASHGAVYARCFGRPIHALGSWFRGRDAGSAATSLVYFMGMYAKPMHVARPYYQPPGDEGVDHHRALEAIREKTALLSRKDLATLVGKEGGNATGKDSVVITFPFPDGNRASRASRTVARVTSLGR